MKFEPFLMLGLGCGFTFGLWVTLNFKNVQSTNFIKSTTEKRALQIQIKSLEDDLIFLRRHQKELEFLFEKGWFIPKNRLIAGDVLEKLRGSLNNIQYTFEPETIKCLEETYTFKSTKIVLEVRALLESDIYAFLNRVSDKFPGILTPQEIILTRGEELSEKTLLMLRQNKRPDFVRGKLVFEWFAMGTKDHEN